MPTNSPVLQRRPQTSYGERTSVSLVRPKSSAHSLPCKKMSRNHINIARFYDWSDDLGACVSVTTLYRDIASLSTVGADLRRPLGVQWCNNGVRLTPGRMFARDKNALTKGEREIINGIYRNRGGHKEHGDTHLIKSHQDAWLAGRQLGRASMRRAEAAEGGSVDSLTSRTSRDAVSTPRRSVECTSTDLQGRVVKSATNRSNTPGHFCVKGRFSVRCSDGNYCHHNGEIPSAPPSTPDHLLNLRMRVPPINNGQGATLIEEDTDVKPSARRVKMDVFLPRITPENMDDDSEAIVSEYSKTRHEHERVASDREQQAINNVCEKKVPKFCYTDGYHAVHNKDLYENPLRFSSPMYLYHRGKVDSEDFNIGE